ncbi:MAG TPA: sigma-70 family RNA polymerase sigma factor [Burkholderiaceae bacterium]|nr:sigma-70 family RNA polymerase sigma factor [Burkholderiaceae bacterium]
MDGHADEESWELQAVADAAGGDSLAFAVLVRHHQSRLFAFLGRMGLRQAEAEELAQDAFVRAWQQLGAYKAEVASFTTWLYTIARRLALNHLDRADVRYLTNMGDVAVDDVTCDRPGPLAYLEQRQQQQRLQAAWRSLTTLDRSILALAYVHGLGIEDVARIERCTPAAARVRIHRARLRLREALQADVMPRRAGVDHE